MSDVSLYLKSHLSNSTLSAVDFAYNNPSLNNISFARDLLNLKIKNTAIKLNNGNSVFRCALDKLNYYELLSKRLDAIDKIPKYKEAFKRGELSELNKESLIKKAKTVACLNDFRNKDFKNIDLNDAWFKNRDLRNTQFNFSKNNEQLDEVIDFSGSNLSDVDLRFALLNSAVFKNSNLSGAKININNADFTDANLDRAELNFQVKSFNENESNYLLNESLSDKTLFHTLNTISNKYKKIKTKLVKELIKSIENSVEMNLPSFPIDSIINNITSEKYYLEDETIRSFAEKLLNIKYLMEKDSMYSKKLSSGPLFFILDLISKLDNESIKEYMMKKNSSFIKLMALSVYHNDLAIQEKGRYLYDKYLETERIKGFVENEYFGNNKKVDWSDKENINYIIVSGDKTIMINHEKLVDMLFFDGKGMDVSWNNFFLYIKDECQFVEGINYFELFNKDFEIFKDSYNATLNKAKSDKLLPLLDLGDYHERFHDALIGRPIEIKQKLTNTDEQEKLIAIFSRLLVTDNNCENENKKIIIEGSHYQKISNAYGFELLTSEEQSQCLFSLASVFVKYSSSSVFGVESDSPQILRVYAYALMLKAGELTPSLQDGNFDRWCNRLLGQGNVSTSIFSCTSEIFSEMKDYGIKYFSDTFRNIVPLHWV